jgi:hypothetical protein
MGLRESTIEQSIVRETRKHGGVAVKFLSPAWRGWPDRLIALPGRPMFFVEVKRPGLDAEPHQEVVHELIAHLGQKVYVVESLREFRAILNHHLSLKPITY